MKLSNFKTSTILIVISLLILLIVNLVFIITINYFFKKEALAEAKEKSEIILDRNLSLHEYFTNELKPVVYRSLSDSLIDGKYFEPAWMSSTYAIGQISQYFKSRNNIAYYYKDAAINARSPKNEADSLELIYLKLVNENPETPPQEGIITIAGEKYYYLLKKGEIMEANCLVCHSTPQNAPQKMVEKYGTSGSFNRKAGEIISIVSIRIPLNHAYERAENNIVLIGAIITFFVFLALIIYVVIQKRLIFIPIEKLRKQSAAISNDNSLLGQVINIKSTKDLNQFVDSFNIMSTKLKSHQDKLEETILERTASLRQSEQKYKLLAENISDVIWVFNANQNKYTYVSPSVKHLTGFTAEQALEQTVDESLEPESARTVKQKLETAINNFILEPDNKKLFYNEIQQICFDNKYIWIETISQLQYNESGEIEVLGVSRNIENRKNAEKQLQKYARELDELNKDKDKFFRILAHDLKQPFNSLLGFSDILIKNVRKYDVDKIEQQLKIINQTTRKTFNLLNDLLTWSNSHSGKIPFEPQNIDFSEVYNEVVSNLKSVATAKNILLAFHESEKIEVFADNNMLRTILRNLISNAIKFTNKGGKINTIVEKNNTEIIVTVSDNGIGMDEETKNKLFSISEQFSNNGTEGEEGTGFGLIICKEFVQRHNGRILVNSEIGKGSDFVFTLPIVD